MKIRIDSNDLYPMAITIIAKRYKKQKNYFWSTNEKYECIVKKTSRVPRTRPLLIEERDGNDYDYRPDLDY